MTISAEEWAASVDPATRAVLVKLLGRGIDVLGVDEARSFARTLVGYLAGEPHGEGLSAGQRARAARWR